MISSNTRYQLRKGGWMISDVLTKLDKAAVQAIRGNRPDLAHKIHVATVVLADVADVMNPGAPAANKVWKPIEAEMEEVEGEG